MVIKDKEEKPVLDLMVLDQTGPVVITLWGDHTRQFLEAKENILRQNRKARLVIRMTGFRIGGMQKNDYNGTILTTIKVLHSKEPSGSKPGTVLDIREFATSPHLLDDSFQVPTKCACITSFSVWRSKLVAAPFRATLFGTVLNVKEMKDSQASNEMRFFDLIDDAGVWLLVCAVGQHAKSKALEQGSQVVLYFACGRSQICEAKPCVYLFKDAVIVMTRKIHVLPVKRSEIQIE